MNIEGYDIDTIAEGAIKLDGLDEAIIGVVEEFGNGTRILYSKNKIIYTILFSSIKGVNCLIIEIHEQIYPTFLFDA